MTNFLIRALLVFCAPLAAFAKSEKNSAESAKQELSSTIQNDRFREWDGAYREGDASDDETSETEITFSGCNPGGCNFKASASFEVTDPALPPGGGTCAYSGKIKFLSASRAVAWNSSNKGAFAGDFAALSKGAASPSWARLVFTLEGNKLTADDEAAASDGFCVRNTAALGSAMRVTGKAESGPAFNCRKAKSAAEKTICKNPSLAAKDRELGAKFKEAKRKAKNAAESQDLGAAQRNFLRDRDRCQDDVRCLDKSYASRLKQLGP